MPSNKQLKQHGLTGPQFESLERSVAYSSRNLDDRIIPRIRHTENGLTYGLTSAGIACLSRNGYISLELVHSDEEIESLNARKIAAIENAKQLLNAGDWKEALHALSTAGKLETATETRRWKLTEKALRVVNDLAPTG